VAQVTGYPYLLAVSERTGFKTLRELSDFGKKNPKKVQVGVNVGSGSQLYTILAMKALNY